MEIKELSVQRTQEEILQRSEDIRGADIFGEYRPTLMEFLDFERIKPFLKDGVTAQEWEQGGDTRLQELVLHYLDWWGQKVEDGRGISVHRGRAQMVNLLWLAGVELWAEVGVDGDEGMNGGWYQQDAYNKVADLFGYPHKVGGKSA